MKGLKIIPLFLLLMIFSYAGMRFVEANRAMVEITFFQYKSEPTAVGLVVLTSVLVGMVICGFLCCIELLSLYMKNKSLRRKIAALHSQNTIAQQKQAKRPAKPSDLSTVSPGGEVH